MNAFLFAATALILVLAPATVFFLDTQRGRVRPHQPGLRLGAALAVVAAVTSIGVEITSGQGPWLITVALASLALILGAIFLFITGQRHVPPMTLRVVEGQAMRHFRAMRDDGSEFISHSLLGQRVLLKFFRGQWCPFCSVELKQFESMRPELSRHGIQIVALSKDSPADAAHHRQRDGLGFTLLSDPELEVIRDYGLEHRKALEISGGRRTLGGLPLGHRPRFTAMAAPTTLLLDEHGVVRWIDQTDDYKVRGDCHRILSAIERAFNDVRFATRERSPASADLDRRPYVACG